MINWLNNKADEKELDSLMLYFSLMIMPSFSFESVVTLYNLDEIFLTKYLKSWTMLTISISETDILLHWVKATHVATLPFRYFLYFMDYFHELGGEDPKIIMFHWRHLLFLLLSTITWTWIVQISCKIPNLLHTYTHHIWV